MLRSTEYFAFCDAVAGRYLHHTPHYEEAHAFHKPGYDTTLSHYLKKFGPPPLPSSIFHLPQVAENCVQFLPVP